MWIVNGKLYQLLKYFQKKIVIPIDKGELILGPLVNFISKYEFQQYSWVLKSINY